MCASYQPPRACRTRMIFVFHPTCKRTPAELQPFICTSEFFLREFASWIWPDQGLGQDRLHRWRGPPAAEDSRPRYQPDRPLRSSGSSGATPRAEIPPPPCPHTPSEAPASAHCELDRRARRRCASAMVKPAPGGQLTPWKLVAPSTTSASSTGRCAPPCPLQPLAGLAPPRPPHNLIAPTRPARPQLPLCTGFFACLSSSRREGAPLLLFCFVACRLSRASACGASVCVNAACGRSASGASRCVCSLLSLI